LQTTRKPEPPSTRNFTPKMPSSSKMTSGNFRTSSYVLGEGNTIKIHYYRSQPSKSEETEQARRMPILLLHGYPQTSFMWKEVVREMSGQYDLVVPDLRGQLQR
jgi:hypothetical protein